SAARSSSMAYRVGWRQRNAQRELAGRCHSRDDRSHRRDEWFRVAAAPMKRHRLRMPSPNARPWRIVALALFAGVFLTAQPMLMNEVAGHHMTLRGVLLELLFWVVWAGFTPFILATANRWPLGLDMSWRQLLPHIVISILLAPIPDFVYLSLKPL